MIGPVRIHRHILAVLVLSVFAAGIFVRAQAPAWKTYSYSTDGFSASFPAEPQIAKKNVATDAGPFELRSYIAQSDNNALFVGVCDYGSAAQGHDPDTMLEGAKDGALSNSKSHLVGAERKITLGVYPGLAFDSESEDGSTHFTARIYVVGTTLYQALVVYSNASPFAHTQEFLDSFQLIARDRS